MRAAAAVASLSLVLLLLLPGCGFAPSLHPLYTEGRSKVVFEQALLGTWRGSSAEGQGDDVGSWTFETGENKAYKLTILLEGHPSKLQAVLVKLGEHRFLDLCPDELTEEQQNCLPLFWIMHVVPVHSFARIQLNGDSLSIAFLDSEWVSEQAKQKKLNIRGETIDDDVFLITAPPSEIQAFLLKCVGNEEAFCCRETLSRVK